MNISSFLPERALNEPQKLSTYSPANRAKAIATKHLLGPLLGYLLLALSALALTPSASANSTLPQRGLIMHLDASKGVQTRGKNVRYWWDQSGYGQDLRGFGTPQLVHGVLNGRPIIQLAKASDRLRHGQLLELPIHDNDRTLIFLTATENAQMKLAYGRNTCGHSFGAKQLANGDSAFENGCTKGTMFAASQVESGRWNLNVLIVRSGTFFHFRNGELVDGRTSSLSTKSGPFEIFAPNLKAHTKGSLKVATVIAYNRALESHELRRAQRYVGRTWFNSNRYFKTTPNLNTLRLPAPDIRMTQASTANNVLKIDYRASFADECEATTGWTRSRATSGQVTINRPQIGQRYHLNCWHQGASASKALSADKRPFDITWQVPRGQANSTTGYRIFLGTESKRYKTIIDVPANPSNSHTLDLAPGNYFLAMKTVGHQGRQSSLSGEIAIKID